MSPPTPRRRRQRRRPTVRPFRPWCELLEDRVLPTTGFPPAVVNPANLDIDGNGKVDLQDALALLKWAFPARGKAGTKPACLEAADVDASGAVTFADGIYLLISLYGDGPKPVPPDPECGEAPAPLGGDDPGSCKK